MANEADQTIAEGMGIALIYTRFAMPKLWEGKEVE